MEIKILKFFFGHSVRTFLSVRYFFNIKFGELIPFFFVVVEKIAKLLNISNCLIKQQKI